VVVTGASSGIGAACALRLAELGYHVFAGARKETAAEEVERRAPGAVEPLRLDVTSAPTIAEAARRVAAAVGPAGLAGLVNNAGIVAAGPLEFVPLDEVRQQFEVNVVGALAVTQAFLPLLRAARGRIVNVSSVSGRIASPFLGPYSASKFALEALSDSLRVELRPWGIRVSLVEPGAVDTPLWEKSLARADEIEKQFPPEARALYGEGLTAMRKLAREAAQSAMPAAVVAAAVAHALTARRPRTRYLLGTDARLAVLLRKLLPDRAWDALIARRLKRAAESAPPAGHSGSKGTP
jgi:NAD(P)-dependent dehydrogenase (short-subunit alcohol dehydrogenase family)